MLALFDGLDIALRLFHLLLSIEQGLLFAFRHVGLVVSVVVNHVGERGRHHQSGYVSATEMERNPAVVVGVYDKVGRYLLQVTPLRLAHRCPRLRVQFPNFGLHLLHLLVGELQLRLYRVPMFLGKGLETLVYHAAHHLLGPAFGLSVNLYQQAFFKRACANASRVERL